MLSKEFLRVFVRSLSLQKGVLFDLALKVKTSIIKLLEVVKISGEHAL